MDRHRRTRKPNGFTLIELLVVVAIITLLISIVLPSLKAVRRSARQSTCMHNLHQVGVGVQAYLLTNKDTFPYVARLPSFNPDDYATLPEAFKRELGDHSEVFRCPADERDSVSPTTGSRHWFDSERTSYEWESLVNGLHVGFKRLTVIDPIWRPWLRDMHIVSDFEPFHRRRTDDLGGTTRLYADMHVEPNK